MAGAARRAGAAGARRGAAGRGAGAAGAGTARRGAPRGVPAAGARRGPPPARAWSLGVFKQAWFFLRPKLPRVLGGRARGGSPAAPMGPVLVAGATGATGQLVVRELVGRGREVRALVRDPDAAEALFSGLRRKERKKLSFLRGDLADPGCFEKLPEGALGGISGVVWAAAAKVGPKEGDDDRAKYRQGVKFYDPELLEVESTPETVDFNGMQRLLSAVGGDLQSGEAQLFVPGAAPKAAGALEWGSLNDNVMGGVSVSGLDTRAGSSGETVAVFKGNVSEENNGGFASIRTRNLAPALDLSTFSGIRLKVKGDGQRFKFTLRDSDAWDAKYQYCLSFDTEEDTWQTIDLPFEEFLPTSRARRVPEGNPLDQSAIHSLQVMLSKFEYDGELNPSFRPGEFELPIESISAYRAQDGPPAKKPCPKFVMVSSCGVTRVGRKDLDLDKEPPAVRMNDMLGGILTFKLKGEDALRESGVPYAIVRPSALTEEPLGAPLTVSQGDTLKGKIGRSEVAELCASLLEMPGATGRTFEIASTVPFSEPYEGPADGATAPARDWGALLGALRPDSPDAGRTTEPAGAGPDLPSGLKDWDAERAKAQKFKGAADGLADQKRYDW